MISYKESSTMPLQQPETTPTFILFYAHNYLIVLCNCKITEKTNKNIYKPGLHLYSFKKYLSIQHHYSCNIWRFNLTECFHLWIDAIHTYFTDIFDEDIYIEIPHLFFWEKWLYIKVIQTCKKIYVSLFSIHMKSISDTKYNFPWGWT